METKFTVEELKYTKACIAEKVSNVLLKIVKLRSIRLSIPAIQIKRDEMINALRRELKLYNNILSKLERKQLAE